MNETGCLFSALISYAPFLDVELLTTFSYAPTTTESSSTFLTLRTPFSPFVHVFQFPYRAVPAPALVFPRLCVVTYVLPSELFVPAL